MDTELSGHDERIFHVWRRSPSVYSSDMTELILAFKISLVLEAPGSKVLKALRRQPGVSEEIVRRVEELVEQDDALGFVEEGETRRICVLAPK